MKNPIKYIFSLLTLAVLAFGPPAARADTLYATANNGLYQFNTAVSPASQSTVTNIFRLRNHGRGRGQPRQRIFCDRREL